MGLGNDLRHAVRTLGRNPLFSAIAVVTLAIGIGANTAIFTIVDGVIIRPLGYGDESRLFVIHEVYSQVQLHGSEGSGKRHAFS